MTGAFPGMWTKLRSRALLLGTYGSIAAGAGQRRELLDSVVAQAAELADLVTELVVLARDDVPGSGAAPASQAVDVDLVAVVRRAVERAARRGDRTIATDLHPGR